MIILKPNILSLAHGIGLPTCLPTEIVSQTLIESSCTAGNVRGWGPGLFDPLFA